MEKGSLVTVTLAGIIVGVLPAIGLVGWSSLIDPGHKTIVDTARGSRTTRP